MLARHYDKQIEIWQSTVVDDGWGGSVLTEVLLSKAWSKITTNGLGNKAIDMGITQFQDPVLFQVRFRPDIEYNGRNLTVRYRGDTYIIQAVRVVNERNREVELFCTRFNPEMV
jgi:head-tail adaptor